MKDYTFSLTAIDKDGNKKVWNETNAAKGYRQGWYKTEEAARKAMNGAKRVAESSGCTNIKYTLYSKIKGIGIIESNA